MKIISYMHVKCQSRHSTSHTIRDVDVVGHIQTVHTYIPSNMDYGAYKICNMT